MRGAVESKTASAAKCAPTWQTINRGQLANLMTVDCAPRATVDGGRGDRQLARSPLPGASCNNRVSIAIMPTQPPMSKCATNKQSDVSLIESTLCLTIVVPHSASRCASVRMAVASAASASLSSLHLPCRQHFLSGALSVSHSYS